MALATFALLAVALLTLPGWTRPLPAIARQALADALPAYQTTEPVNAVVYGIRAMDTFGETFLLLAAVVSVNLLARTRERRRGFVGEQRAGEEEQRFDPNEPETPDERAAREAELAEAGDGASGPDTPDEEPLGLPAPERAVAMTVVTRNAIRVVLPLLAIAGCFLVAEGYSPGGGFPAGAVLVGVVLLVYAGFGYPRIERCIRPDTVEPVELAGALFIIAVLALGLPLAGAFAANWVPLAPEQTIRSGGMIQLFSVGELIEVGSGLVIATFALLGIRHDWAQDRS